jgi:hypothetical protein
MLEHLVLGSEHEHKHFNFAEPERVLEHLTLEHLVLTLKLIKTT